MRHRTVFAALAALLALPAALPAQAASNAALDTQATPPGITLQPAQGPIRVPGARIIPGTPLFLADEAGRTLYVGAADCAADCAAKWQALDATAAAVALGDFAPLARADGKRQWSYRGKPLYRSAADQQPGDVKGVGVDPAFALAEVEPALGGGDLPPAFGLVRNAKAGGEVLVDHRGMTLYVLGDVKCDASCRDHWIPVAAGALAKAAGDWSIATAADGQRHWLYRGTALYSFSGDLKPGQANGAHLDGRGEPAMVRRDFLPASVSRRFLNGRVILATADGRTLYARDRYRYSGGNFNTEDGPPPSPATGRSLGPEACTAECLATWQPLLAAADAVPTGYWHIVARPDGQRQWAYQGYALYTNAGDTRPGDAVGRDRFDLVTGSDALYWRVATP